MSAGRKKRLRSFDVSGRHFDISYVKESVVLDTDDMGHSDYDLGEVIVRTHRAGRKIPEDTIRETLWHEITHLAFWAAGLDESATDEHVTWQMSAVIRQIFDSLK